jgi:hypothetical protein
MTDAATRNVSSLAVAVAAVAAAVLTIVWRFLNFAGFNNDHYVVTVRAFQMLLGEWPVRDFADPGMPLMYAVHAAAAALFGPAVGVELAVVIAGLAVGAACTVLAAARLSGSVGIALLVTAFEVALNPRSYSYPKILLYAAAALVIMRAARDSAGRWPVALAGVTAIAFLFRHDHGLFLGIGCFLVIAVASARSHTPSYRPLTVFVGSLAAFLAPWALWVQSHQGLGQYFWSGIEFSRGEAAGNALRALPRVNWPPLDTLDNGLAWLFYLFHVLPLICLGVLVSRKFRDRAWPGEGAAVAALAVTAIPVNVTFLRGSLEARVPDAAVMAALLGAWLLGDAFGRGNGRRPLRIACATSMIALTAWATIRAADVPEQFRRTRIPRGPEVLRLRTADLWHRLQLQIPEGDHVPSRYARGLIPFIEYAQRCTARDDRLLVTALFPEINVMAQRGFAGGHPDYQTGLYTSERDQAWTLERLQRQSVPFVVIVTKWFPELRPQMTRIFDYIDRRYVLLAHIPVPETEGVELLVERARPFRVLDTMTGWPCFEPQSNSSASSAGSKVHAPLTNLASSWFSGNLASSSRATGRAWSRLPSRTSISHRPKSASTSLKKSLGAAAACCMERSARSRLPPPITQRVTHGTRVPTM